MYLYNLSIENTRYLSMQVTTTLQLSTYGNLHSRAINLHIYYVKYLGKHVLLYKGTSKYVKNSLVSIFAPSLG